MTDCIFCKIVDGIIPNHTVYEDAHALAFLDINPCSKGHTVVIPKIHASTFNELNEELVGELFVAVQRTMNRITRTLHPDGYNVGWNHGEAGGQAVHHLHVHILPRWEGDGGGNMHSIIQAASEVSVEEIADMFNT